MRNKVYLTGVEGVASPGTARALVPTNRRAHRFVAFYTESAVAADVTVGITAIRAIVNGVVLRNILPAEALSIALLNLNKNGISIPTGVLPIYLSEPWRRTITGEEATSWPLQGQNSMILEFDIATGRTAPGLVIMQEYDFGVNVDQAGTPFVSPITQRPYNYPVAAGTFDITNLPITAPIQRIHLQGSGGISAVYVERDDEKVYEASTAQNRELLAAQGLDQTAAAASPGSFTFPIVFDATQQLTDPLLVDRTLLVRPTSGGSQNVRALLEARPNRYA